MEQVWRVAGVRQVGREGFVGKNMFPWMDGVLSLLVGGVEELGSSAPGWLPNWLCVVLLGPSPHPHTSAGCTAWLGSSLIYSVGEAAWALSLDKLGVQIPAPSVCALTSGFTSAQQR